jgi:hypothetical protein
MYRQGFQEALDSYYPGLNALSLLTIAIELAQKLPDIWEIPFDTKEQADRELARLEAERRQLEGAVGLALDSAKRRLARTDGQDRWLSIGLADYAFLIGNKPKKLAFEYASSLSGAADFYFDAARAQLELFQSLGLRTESVTAALTAFKSNAVLVTSAPPARVILFTGHMIDPPDAKTARFPNSLQDPARSAILGRLQQEVARTAGPVIALASAANGGDLLFHDACEELGVDHRLHLPLLPDLFRNQSVSPGGRFWEDRFDALLKKFPTFSYLATSPELPLWLSIRKDYTSWQRANLWLIHEALATGAPQFTLLSLWDGVETSGIGGTYHMRRVAEQANAALVTIDLASLGTAAT